MANSNGTEVYTANYPRLTANTLTLTLQNPVQQLPASVVPEGVGVLIKSDPGNPPTSIILVDGIRPGPTSYPLTVNEEKLFYVKNTSELWVGARTPIPAPGGLTICYIHEAD